MTEPYNQFILYEEQEEMDTQQSSHTDKRKQPVYSVSHNKLNSMKTIRVHISNTDFSQGFFKPPYTQTLPMILILRSHDDHFSFVICL